MTVVSHPSGVEYLKAHLPGIRSPVNCLAILFDLPEPTARGHQPLSVFLVDPRSRLNEYKPPLKLSSQTVELVPREN